MSEDNKCLAFPYCSKCNACGTSECCEPYTCCDSYVNELTVMNEHLTMFQKLACELYPSLDNDWNRIVGVELEP